MRLRGRLLLSYLLLLGITLAIITGVLLLFLFNQPPSATDAYERLGAIGRDVVQQAGLADQPRLRELRELLANLPLIAQDNEVRILIVDVTDQTVSYDTANQFQSGTRVPLEPESFTLPIYLRRSFAPRSEPIFGRFQDVDGSIWFYAGITATARGQQNNAIILAESRGQQTPQAAWQRFRETLAAPLCQSALIGIIIAMLLAGVITRNITRSLTEFGRAAAAVAKGRYDQRVTERGAPEIRAVAAAFNRMTTEVQNNQQAQKDFVANVSHDLKTPLTSIQGYSQAIMDGAAKDTTAAARIIYEESGRLNRMVTQLTDLARLQAGRLSMHIASVDFSQLVQVVAERVKIIAQEKQITLHVQTPNLPALAGDGDRLAQVVTNLLSNALKYTPQGGTVWVEVAPQSNSLVLKVRDTGIGIPTDELPRVFERFYQVDKTRGPRRGSGLGLAITQEIVQAHGGSITVTSPGKGQGSTFTVALPLKPAPPSA
jgi:signal transduction histidine kinase